MRGARAYAQVCGGCDERRIAEWEIFLIAPIVFTVYSVSNMERARSFYEHILGLHMTYRYRDVWTEYDLDDLTFAITTIEMGYRSGAKGTVVTFEVSDLNAFLHLMKKRTVSIVTDVFDRPVCRMVGIEDPDGNHITIHKRLA